MKFVFIGLGMVILVPVLLALTFVLGHPRNFPFTGPHDFSKKGYVSEMHIQVRCAWLVFCDSAPYQIALVLPVEGNSRYLAQSLDDTVFPGPFHITVIDHKTRQKMFDEVVRGGWVRHQSGRKAAEGLSRNLPSLSPGSYTLFVENLEGHMEFDNPLGEVVLQWVTK